MIRLFKNLGRFTIINISPATTNGIVAGRQAIYVDIGAARVGESDH